MEISKGHVTVTVKASGVNMQTPVGQKEHPKYGEMCSFFFTLTYAIDFSRSMSPGSLNAPYWLVL